MLHVAMHTLVSKFILTLNYMSEPVEALYNLSDQTQS